MILAPQSRFLKSLLLQRHAFEFEILDWDGACAHLLDRQKQHQVTIQLPDIPSTLLSLALSCFYKGEISVTDVSTLSQLTQVWDVLRFDVVKLGDLDLADRCKEEEKEAVEPEEVEELSSLSSSSSSIKRRRLPSEPSKPKRARRSTRASTRANPDRGLSQKRLSNDEEDGRPSFICMVCHKKKHYRFEGQFKSTFIRHVITHFKPILFGDIPTLSKYCPHSECGESRFARNAWLLRHLCLNHDEFVPRIRRRLRQLKSFHDDLISGESRCLKKVEEFCVSKGWAVPASEAHCNLLHSAEVLVYRKHEAFSIKCDRLTCTICDDGFKHEQPALVHLFTKHGIQPYQDCFKTFDGHFKCYGCQFHTQSRLQLVHHFGSAHDAFRTWNVEQKLRGLILHRLFQDADSRTSTTDISDHDLLFVCCGEVVNTSELMSHFKSAHSQPESLKISVQCFHCRQRLEADTPEIFESEVDHSCSCKSTGQHRSEEQDIKEANEKEDRDISDLDEEDQIRIAESGILIPKKEAIEDDFAQDLDLCMRSGRTSRRESEDSLLVMSEESEDDCKITD